MTAYLDSLDRGRGIFAEGTFVKQKSLVAFREVLLDADAADDDGRSVVVGSV